MKKISKLSIIMLLLMVCLTVNVYARPNCKLNMETKQTEIVKGKEFTIDVNLSDIQSERGIIAIEATLEYEKDCLTLSKMEGQNSWDTPIKGLSYNESNGKLVIDKKGLAKSNETILKITFKENETNNKNTTVSLRNIVVADGTAPAKVADATKTITIKNEEQKPGEEQKPSGDQKPNGDKNPSTNTTPDEGEKPNTNTIISEEQKPDTNQIIGDTKRKEDDIASGKLPHTGKERNLVIILVILLLIVVITGIFIYRKRKNNKKSRHSKI